MSNKYKHPKKTNHQKISKNKKSFLVPKLVIFICLIVIGYTVIQKSVTPKTTNWSIEHQFISNIETYKNQVYFNKFRNFIYERGSIKKNQWTQKAVDNEYIEKVEIIISEENNIDHIPKEMIVFDLGIQGKIAISIEPRLKSKQLFSRKKGFFNIYDLIYVIGSENDLLTARKLNGNPLYRLPLNITPEESIQLFTDMITSTKKTFISTKKYNSIFRHSNTEIRKHLYQVTGKKVSNNIIKSLYKKNLIDVPAESLEVLKEKTNILSQ